MRHVTSDAAVRLHGCVLESKWTLLVGMALNARRVSADRQPRLLQLKTTVRVVTVAAAHRALEHLVVGRHRELMFHLGVTAQTELWFTNLQQLDRREIRLLGIRGCDKRAGAGDILTGDCAVR